MDRYARIAITVAFAIALPGELDAQRAQSSFGKSFAIEIAGGVAGSLAGAATGLALLNSGITGIPPKSLENPSRYPFLV